MPFACDQELHRILLVDDDIDLLMLLERRLVKEGFVIETAASLLEAEEIVVNFDPHLILLDININGADGRQLCWKLKHAPNTFPPRVLLMSGFDCSLSRAALFGADGIIAKPIQTEYLLHCIGQQLHMPNMPVKKALASFKDNLG
jgi:DNA-binding response OmpR family regulator